MPIREMAAAAGIMCQKTIQSGFHVAFGVNFK
jgi:hypothetical protein